MKEIVIKSKIVGRGTETGPGRSVASIDLSAYALKSDLLKLETSFNDFLQGEDTDDVINRWKELETFLGGISESYNLLSILQGKADKATTLSGYGITDAYTKTNVDDLLKSYVTLGGTQTITGEKNFTGGLKVNGSPIVYDSTKKYWKLEGDLLVTGGITMYGNEGTYTPSTIMDAINVDGTTISKEGGVLRVIGGTGGGTADSVAWANITGKPTFASVATSGKYDDLIGKPTLLSSFTDDVVSGKYLPLSGGTMKGDIELPILSGKPTSLAIMFSSGTNKYLYRKADDLYFGVDGQTTGKIWHSANLNPHSLDSTLTISTGNDKKLILNNTDTDTNYSRIDFQQNGVSIGQLGIQSVGTTYLSWTGDGGNHRILHAGNYSNYALPLSGGVMTGDIEFTIPEGKTTSKAIKFTAPNVNYLYAKADELYYGNDGLTTGKIWHSANDGSGSGLDADLLDGKHLSDILASNVASATKLQTARTIWGQSFDGTGNVSGTVKTMSGHGLHLAVSDDTYWQSKGIISTSWISGIGDYTDILVPSSASNTAKIRLIKDGNVGIGVDNPSQKLHVGGNVKCNIIYGTNLYANTGGEGLYISGSGIYYHNSSSSWMSDLMYFTSTGNVGIGTTSPTEKLHVVGNAGFFKSSSAANVSISFINSSTDLWQISGRFDKNSSTENNRLNTYYYNGSTWANIMSLFTSGDMLVSGGITMYGTSDKRLKKNIRTLSASDTLMSLGGVYQFEYIDDEVERNSRYKGTHFGLIYQNVKQTSLAKMCYEREDGYGALNYIDTSFISLLAGVGMEHETRIQKLERENKELRAEVEQLKSA